MLERLSVVPLTGLPLFGPGMALAAALVAAARGQGEGLDVGDVLVVAQKIVSKAEGLARSLAAVRPGVEARALAEQTRRVPALAELILSESSEILRATPAAIIARHRSGHVLANAGIDASNMEGGHKDTVLLWPKDPDASARALRAGLSKSLGGNPPAVIIADSMGRAWRIGTQGTAIGCAGVVVGDDQRGQTDLFGRTLQATLIAVADSIAAIAVLAMGEGAQGTPAAIVRGVGHWVSAGDGPGAASGLRPLVEDMFR